MGPNRDATLIRAVLSIASSYVCKERTGELQLLSILLFVVVVDLSSVIELFTLQVRTFGHPPLSPLLMASKKSPSAIERASNYEAAAQVRGFRIEQATGSHDFLSWTYRDRKPTSYACGELLTTGALISETGHTCREKHLILAQFWCAWQHARTDPLGKTQPPSPT